MSSLCVTVTALIIFGSVSPGNSQHATDGNRGFGDIEIQPSTLAVELAPGGTAEIDFQVHNAGDGVLSIYSIEADVPWITVQPATFTLESNETETVYVTVDAGSLAEGVYDQVISIESNDPDDPMITIPIRVTVQGTGVPNIQVTPESLELQVIVGQTVQDTIQVTNEGAADLIVSSITGDVVWLSALPGSFTLSPGGVQLVTVFVDASALDPDTYNQVLTITSNDPDEGSLSLPVQVTVAEENLPDIVVSPTIISVTFGPGSSETETITIRNMGTADLLIDAITADQSWISVDANSATIPAGDSTVVNVEIQSASQNQGTYSGTISISSNDPDEPLVEIPVTEILGSTGPLSNPQSRQLLLKAPSPNPSAGITMFELHIPSPAHVLFAIYDEGGRRIRTLCSDRMPVGTHYLEWAGRTDGGSEVSPGNYFARVEAADQVRVVRVLRLR